MRLKFIEDKSGKYILFILAFISLALCFGCTLFSKASKEDTSQSKEFTIDESSGVEMRDVEPLEDLTTPLSEEETGEPGYDEAVTMINLEEMSSLLYEEDILKERVVIDVENTPLHDVIQTLVRGRGFNLILPEKLMGLVSADFEDITLQDAFNQLLQTYGYTWTLEGNFLKIIKGEPIWQYKLKYIPVDQTNAQASLGGRGQQGKIVGDLTRILAELEDMCPQGKFVINSWAGVITGIGLPPSVIPYLEAYLRTVDVKRKQILMEASILKVELNDQYQAGINWDMAFEATSMWSTGRGIPIQGWSDSQLKMFALGGFFTGAIANDHLTAVIEAFEGQGKVNVLSSPKVVTLDSRSAYMVVSDEQIYFEESVTYPGGGQSAVITHKSVTKKPRIELGVIPRVSDDGYIYLNVYTIVEEVVGSVPSESGPVPRMASREMNTIARTLNGQTIVIGGLIQEQLFETINKIPLLGDIPLIGGLFRRTEQKNIKSELVIFITPHILDDTKIKQFTDEDRMSIKKMQESNIRGRRPLLKDH